MSKKIPALAMSPAFDLACGYCQLASFCLQGPRGALTDAGQQVFLGGGSSLCRIRTPSQFSM
jgi:hypothetical protein